MWCTENVDEVKIAEITSTELLSAKHENVCVCSYTICVVLTIIALEISIGIGVYFAYKCINHWYSKKDVIRINFGTRTQSSCIQTKI